MSKFKQFATCHCHPASLDSASTPEAFAKREVELGSGVITCTDHGSLAAAQQIYALGKKNGLIPVIGLEGYFRDDDCPILKANGIQKTTSIPRGMDHDEWKTAHPDGSFYDYLKYMHVSLHFMDHDAYLCAVRLLSKADARAERHGSERKALFSWSDLEELAAHNVTATSSCLVGMVQRHLLDHKNTDVAKAYFNRMHHLFNDRFYVEVFPHVCSHNWVNKVFLHVEAPDGTPSILKHYGGKIYRTNRMEESGISVDELAQNYRPGYHTDLVEVKNYRKWEQLDPPLRLKNVEKKEDFFQNECSPSAPDGDIQWGTNMFVLGMAKKHNVPVLIADDSHFAHPEEKVVQDVRLAQQGDWKFWGSYHRQSSEEAWEYFRDKMSVQESVFESWIENTHDWAGRFKDFKMDTKPSLPTKFYPKDSLAYTKQLIKQHGRMQNKPEYLERLKNEIDVLHRNGTLDLLPYFHIDEEMCKLYENQEMLTGPGRGSAAGLLICYLLGITHVDPLKYGLSQERFITPDRIRSGKLPDIDQDLPSRDLLVGWNTDVIEVEMEDGSIHTLPESLKVPTDQGILTIREALAAGADIKPWWLEKTQDIEK